MKRVCLLFFTCIFLATASSGQLTGIKNIPGDYVSLATAITDLNNVGAGSGGVIFNVIAGNPQTAPAGGYVIGNTGSAILSGAGVTSSTKTVTIQGNGNTITAFSPQAAGNGNDAIIKLIGADWITITGFTLQENSGNAVFTPATSNNMTEWAIGLFHVTSSDGAQHNTIQGNTITMERLYRNSFGIYSNARHTMEVIDVQEEISSAAGANSGNKIYGNTISNVNYPVLFNGSITPDYYDAGNDIGGSSSSTGNVISNWGYLEPQQDFVDAFYNTGSRGIGMLNQQDENVSWNNITSASVSNDNGIAGIIKYDFFNNGPASGTHTSTYDNNSITVLQGSGAITAIIAGIQTYSAALVNNVTVSITNNTILNCSMTGVSSAADGYMISAGMACGTLTITGNIIKGNSTSVLSAGSFYGIYNSGTVSDAISISNNQLGIAGSGMVTSTATGGIGNLSAIYNTTSGPFAIININNNSVDGISCASSTGPLLIRNNAPTANAVNINNNRFGTVTGTTITFTSATTGPFYAIFNGSSLSTCAIDISGNDIRGVVNTVSGVQHRFIWNGAVGTSQNISNNTFTNIVSRCTGNVYFIRQLGDMLAGGSFTCSNNSIVGTYSKTLAGGQVYFLQSTGNAAGSTTITQTGNNFSNVTLTGNTALTGWDEGQGASEGIGPVKTITGNTFSNITVTGTGTASVIFLSKGGSTVCSGNTISNTNAVSSVYGIHVNIAGSGGTYTINTNAISGLSCTAAGAEVTGIRGGVGQASVAITSNTISNLSTTASASDATGINFGGSATVISRNTITSVSCAAAASVSSGISVSGGSSVTLFRNKISGITHTYTGSSAVPLVHGLLILNGLTVTAYSNFIAALTAPSVSGTDVVRGISVTSAASSGSYYLYYNSVYINASSSGTDFGTTAVFDSAYSAPTKAALTMINNIFVNTSTPAGAGVTAAFRRSATDLDNYTSSSDHNLFYAGTPGVARLIFSDGTNADQTLADYQARVTARDAYSISEMPVFVSATDLHLLSNVNCKIDRKGIPITGITVDIDGFIRDATTPDIGADEFTTVPSNVLAGVTGSTICDARTLHPSGSDFTNSDCELIARVVPAGASPVSGHVNTCVYIDPVVVPTYNAEPYVQRHFDIEPAVNASTATGRVTLYFNDADFVNFNANNASWPDLPTLAGGGSSDPNIANLRISQYHGTPLTSPSSPNQYSAGTAEFINPDDFNIQWSGSYWGVTFDVTGGFSGFYVHTNLRWVLPIEVNYFKGSRQGNVHLLNWKLTCNASPSVTVTLERSSSATGSFVPVYSLQTTTTRCNQPFDYTDIQPLPGMNYYRVKMSDANGRVTYSSIVPLLNAVKGFDIVSITPNPVVNNQLVFNSTSAQPVTMQLVILDMQGRPVKREQVRLIAGYTTTSTDISQLPSGMYSLYGVSADGRSSVLKFIKR